MKKNFFKKKFYLGFCLFLMSFVPLSSSAQYQRGDVNEDGSVGISDVTTLIDYLLSGFWPGEGSLQPKDTTITVYGVPFKMVYVEGGTFTMGATSEQGNSAQSDEKPAHRVTLSPFFICSTEVTQELWLEVMGLNPSYFVGTNLPVEGVSWDDCQQFVAALKEITGLDFRLPTEAEWEYAARGGKMSQGYIYSGSNTLNDVAWHPGNSGSKTHQVATKLPNELGLYDMSGNVREWCYDWYGNYIGPETNPNGPTTGTYRVQRGGYWFLGSDKCRVSARDKRKQNSADGEFGGLRLALSFEQ